MQNKTSAFDKKKKLVTRFGKKIVTWQKKSIDKEKNLLLRTLKKKTLSLRTQRRRMTEDHKVSPFNEKAKEDPYYCET